MDDPSSSSTALVSLVFWIIFVVTVIALIGYFNRVSTEVYQEKVIEQPSTAVRDLRAEQLGKIREYRWVDQDSGTVAIPIERAMELVVEERAQAGRAGSGS
jgi:hypothetical protein